MFRNNLQSKIIQQEILIYCIPLNMSYSFHISFLQKDINQILIPKRNMMDSEQLILNKI